MADEKSPSLPSQKDATSSRSSAKATANEKELNEVLARARQTIKPIINREAANEIVSDNLLDLPMKAMSSGNDAGEGFRRNLRRIRALRGMTQAEMATRAGVAAASISHFETGQRAPALDTLVKLADALNVTVDTILGRAPLEAAAQLDPVFVQASQADLLTLETVRRVTAAILADAEKGVPNG